MTVTPLGTVALGVARRAGRHLLLGRLPRPPVHHDAALAVDSAVLLQGGVAAEEVAAAAQRMVGVALLDVRPGPLPEKAELLLLGGGGG